MRAWFALKLHAISLKRMGKRAWFVDGFRAFSWKRKGKRL